MGQFQDFWPSYLRDHQNPVCRALHYSGTSIGLFMIAWGLWEGPLWLIPLAFVVGYAFSWVGHFVFEKNRPATFHAPWLSFLGDFRMLLSFVTGRIDRELAKYRKADWP